MQMCNRVGAWQWERRDNILNTALRDALRASEMALYAVSECGAGQRYQGYSVQYRNLMGDTTAYVQLPDRSKYTDCAYLTG